MTRDPDRVRLADVLVVPGQGSFGAFAAALDERGLREAVREKIAEGTPYLGICLGLQVLFESSAEAPGARGLGVFAGAVNRLAPGTDSDGRPLALPHIGWNLAEPRGAGSLVVDAHYYFAHTFAAAPADPAVVLATTSYGTSFASAVGRDNVAGVQFHPEKSQRAGLGLIARFFDSVARKERAL